MPRGNMHIVFQIEEFRNVFEKEEIGGISGNPYSDDEIWGIFEEDLTNSTRKVALE